MARPATARRPTADGRRTAAPAAWTDLPDDTFPATQERPQLLANALLPMATMCQRLRVPALDSTPPAGVTPEAFWAPLPADERERFGLRLSRLVLRAVRCPDTSTKEDV